MKKNEKVVLDFTQTNSPEVAVMSAPLAKRLLRMLSYNLVGVSSAEIIYGFVEDIRKCDNDLDKVIAVTQAFTEERHIIKHVSEENWDAYKVEPEKAEPELAK